MNLTEDEARKKRCCGPSGCGLSHVGETWRRCVASECMAFRWAPDRVISLSNGVTVVVDEEDGDWAENLGLWWDGRYPRCDAGRLHVLLFEQSHGPVPDGLMVDHIDGDTENCRRRNLRLATAKQNAANSASRGGASQYRGVHRAGSGKWVAQISKDGVRECLGSFESELNAAAAYDNAARRVHGEFARLNLTPPKNVGRRGYCGLAGRP